MGNVVLVAATTDPERIEHQLREHLKGSTIQWLAIRDERVNAVADLLKKCLGRREDFLAHCEQDQIPSYIRALLRKDEEYLVLVVPEKDIFGLLIRLTAELTLTPSEVSLSPVYFIDVVNRKIRSLAA